MAQKLWKRKRPPREVKQLKPEFKIEEAVFDPHTFKILYDFLNRGIISSLDYPIATGKEADVYRATTGQKLKEKYGDYLAVKIFRINTGNFLHMQDYIRGDRRFSNVKRAKRHVVFAWTRKEFSNLRICEEAGVPAPRPVKFQDNVLVMEFLGENGIPDSTLKQIGSENPEQDFREILEAIKKLYRHELVHSDVSEFNIMMHGTPPKPHMIDIGQGVLTSHPKAEEFLRRDVENVVRYFSKYGVKSDAGPILEWVKGKRKSF